MKTGLLFQVAVTVVWAGSCHSDLTPSLGTSMHCWCSPKKDPPQKERKKEIVAIFFFNLIEGVPVVAQWLTNPTRNHEVVGLIPGLAQ